MTTLTLLPYKHVNTYLPSQCSIEHMCIDCFADTIRVSAEEFDGDQAVVYWDSEGDLVAVMTYYEGDNKPFEKAVYFVEELIVNICGKRKLSDVVSEMCTYVTTVDDSFGDFRFSCNINDPQALLLQEFAEFISYTPSDETMYFYRTV